MIACSCQQPRYVFLAENSLFAALQHSPKSIVHSSSVRSDVWSHEPTISDASRQMQHICIVLHNSPAVILPLRYIIPCMLCNLTSQCPPWRTGKSCKVCLTTQCRHAFNLLPTYLIDEGESQLLPCFSECSVCCWPSIFHFAQE